MAELTFEEFKKKRMEASMIKSKPSSETEKKSDRKTSKK